jgi:hypothetical protein
MSEASRRLNADFELIPLLWCTGDAPLTFRQSWIEDVKMVAFAKCLGSGPVVTTFLTRSLAAINRTSLFSLQSIRHFLLLWYFPAILQNAPLLYRLCQYLQNPPVFVRYVFDQWLMFLPLLLERMATACQTAIQQFFRNSPTADPKFSGSTHQSVPSTVRTDSRRIAFPCGTFIARLLTSRLSSSRSSQSRRARSGSSRT